MNRSRWFYALFGIGCAAVAVQSTDFAEFVYFVTRNIDLAWFAQFAFAVSCVAGTSWSAWRFFDRD